MKTVLFIATSLIGLTGFENCAHAQWNPGSNVQPGGISYQTTPTVSPYLQLNRAGGSAALNYTGLVRPTFDIRNSINGIQQQISDAQSTGTGTDSSLLTGGRTRFLYTGSFFLNISGQSSIGGGGRGTNNLILVSPQQNQTRTVNIPGGAPGMIPQR